MMSKLGKRILFRNTTAINQTVQVAGHWTTVIPSGLIEDFERGQISRIRGFKRAPEAVTTADHLASLANANAAPDVDTAQEYPYHIGGGKWGLSDGTVTAGGIKRADAEELQAQIDAAAQVAAESEAPATEVEE